MQGRGRGRGGPRGYNRNWGNSTGALAPPGGPGTGIGSVGSWFQGYGHGPVTGSGVMGGWRQVGYPGRTEMEFGSQPPPGQNVRGTQISGTIVGMGSQKNASIREDCHQRVGAGGGQFGAGIGALGRVGPGAAVYPDRRSRAGGRGGVIGARAGIPGMGQYGAVRAPVGGTAGRPSGQIGRAEAQKRTGSSAGGPLGGAAATTVARGTEDKKQVCQFFLRTGTCAFGNRCKFFHPKDHRPPQLNPKGYPVRPDEKSCSFYMKHGWCAFGATCKFNHPFPPPDERSKSPMPPMTPPLQQTPVQQSPLAPNPMQSDAQAVDASNGQFTAPVYSPVAPPLSHPIRTLPVAASSFGSWPSVPNPWYPVGIPSGERAKLYHPIHSGPTSSVVTVVKPERPEKIEQKEVQIVTSMASQKVDSIGLPETSEESGRSSRTSFDGSFSHDEASSQLCRPARRGQANEVQSDAATAWNTKEEQAGIKA